MKYKVLIVDDEEPARDLLKSYAQKLEELEVVAVLNNALEAIKIINQGDIDILLSDIQMDDLTGIDLVKTVRQQPVTIFTTAYSEYALDGFDLGIIDYLVKPISFQRFCQAIDKAKELVQYKQSPQQAIPPDHSSASSPQTESDYFFVKTDRKMVKVMYQDILFVQSFGEYVKIFTKDDVLLALQTTSYMEQTLPAGDFKRIHRSHIVNINQIKEIEGNEVVIDRHRLAISKRMKDSFMRLIQEKGIV